MTGVFLHQTERPAMRVRPGRTAARRLRGQLRSSRRVSCSLLAVAALAALAAAGCAPSGAKRVAPDPAKKAPEAGAAAALASRAAIVPFRVPDESEIRDSVVRAAVRRGRAI